MFHLWHSKARLSILELRLMEFYNFYNSIVLIFSLSLFIDRKFRHLKNFLLELHDCVARGIQIEFGDGCEDRWTREIARQLNGELGRRRLWNRGRGKEREERRQKEGRRRKIETGLGEKYKVATRKRGGGGIKNFNNTFPRPAGATRGKLYSTIPCSFPGDCPSFIK